MAKNLVLQNSDVKTTLENIKKIFETILQATPPNDFIDLYLNTNGGTPSKPFIKNSVGVFIRIKRFLPIAVESEFSRNIEETVALGRSRGFLPEGILPFAIDEGGNYLCMTKTGGIVYYTLDNWDDELSMHENINKSSEPLSPNFSDFMLGLRKKER